MPALLTSSGRPGFYLRVLQEGEVGPGDEIVQVGEAKERMTVAEINALLYSPDHARDRLERALRIEALSPGWRSSFEALLQSQTSGNAGLVPEAAAHPAAPGFRPLTVTVIDQESADVLSLTMQSPDGQPLPTVMPGQYVVLRLQRATGGPPLFRSYRFRVLYRRSAIEISVKIEPNGAAGNLPAEACASGRCSRRQLASRNHRVCGDSVPVGQEHTPPPLTIRFDVDGAAAMMDDTTGWFGAAQGLVEQDLHVLREDTARGEKIAVAAVARSVEAIETRTDEPCVEVRRVLVE